jgi:hypothetical protein
MQLAYLLSSESWFFSLLHFFPERKVTVPAFQIHATVAASAVGAVGAVGAVQEAEAEAEAELVTVERVVASAVAVAVEVRFLIVALQTKLAEVSH